MQTYLDVAFPLELYLEVLSYGSVTFKFFRMAVPMDIPTSCVQELPFLHTLTNTSHLLPFW